VNHATPGNAGEMKKGVFTVANYFAPKRDVLSKHCSATADKKTGVIAALRPQRHGQNHALRRPEASSHRRIRSSSSRTRKSRAWPAI
jgi:hypothetical protein